MIIAVDEALTELARESRGVRIMDFSRRVALLLVQPLQAPK